MSQCQRFNIAAALLLAFALLLAEPTAASVHVLNAGRGLWIQWQDVEGELHAEWLRERCQSEAVVDLVTLQPKVSANKEALHDLIEQIPYRGQRRVPTTFLSLKITGRDNVDALHATYHSSPG